MAGRLVLASSARIHLFSSRISSGKFHSLASPLKSRPLFVNTPNLLKRYQSTSNYAELELEESQLSLPAPSPEVTAPSLWGRFKHHTGLATLVPEWKLMFSKKDLMNDVLAGVTVGCVALPLSLAIALASGVSPEVGIVSAVVGGTVASIFGGAPLGVTGPSLATSVLLASIAATHGVPALVAVTCVTGGLQILSGVLRLGNIVRFVPQPVISGFSAGVGGVMLLGQLPRVLGLSQPSAPGLSEMFTHVLTELSNIHPASIALSLGTLATTLILPRFLPKVPASLVAVAAAAGLNAVLGLGAPVIGDITCAFPSPSLPNLDMDTMTTLMGSSLALYGLTSLESLLSGSAADKIDKEDPRKHNPNVDLVGQGLSNLAVSCFGGIPVTGAIARTSLNITAGAKTRRASIVHVGVIGAVFALGPVVSTVPLAALSGILLSVALRLLNPRELKFLSKVSYKEVVPLAATFSTVLASDLVTGVEVGVATAVAMQLASRVPKLLSFSVDDNNFVELKGDITFLSASRVVKLQQELLGMAGSAEYPITIDFHGVRTIDATAGEMIVDIIYDMEDKGQTPQTFKLVGLGREHRRVLSVCDSRGLIAKFIQKH